MTSKFLAIFSGKVFDMDFLQKNCCICMVFFNAQKRTQQKAKKKISGVGWFLGI
jgi:hypothetical protein